MPRVFVLRAARRASALAAGGLLTFGATIGVAPASQEHQLTPGFAGPQSASSAVVLHALGIVRPRAEIVILVDTSLSMAPAANDLYPAVRRTVLAYLGVLAEQDPQDLVGMVLFGGPSQNLVIFPGQPSSHIFLPKAPYTNETDFGFAFQQAVQMFRVAPAGIKAGSVLLLSDGELSVPDGDPVYGTGFRAQGWQELRTEVRNLRLPVTAYDVPLTTVTAYTANQYHALTQVFDPVQSLPYGTANLSRSLDLATQGTLDSEVASAVAPDRGKGVDVTWSTLPGTGGRPLDLARGHAEVAVTVTSATRKVPLYLSRLSVTSAGLPVTLRARLPGDRMLAPGQSATWKVRLTWHPKSKGATWWGEPQQSPGRLILRGQVASTFTARLRSTFADTSFSVGQLRRATSARFEASEPAAHRIWPWLLLLIVAIGLGVWAFRAASRARLSGTLLATPEGCAQQTLDLRGWRKSTPASKLLEQPGLVTVTVRRFPGSRLVRAGVRIDGRWADGGTLPPGEEVTFAGVHLRHNARERPRRNRKGSTDPASQGAAGKITDPS